MHRTYLIKPASSLCNLKCKYCFYYDEIQHREISNYGIMKQEVMESLIIQTLDLSDEITYAFQGGEPTRAGLEWFLSFTSFVERHKKNQIIHYSIQTNGVHLNHDWITFFKQYHFLVGVSLDGFQKIHDSLRGHYKEVIQFIQLLKENQIEYNILTVLTEELSKYPKELYEFYKQQNFSYVQFIPCLPDLEHPSPYALKPESFYSFYHTLFKYWYEDIQKGEYHSISLFDELMTLFSGKAPGLCGMLGRCSVQFVVEGNGNVYPCDFYCLDEYCMGNLMTKPLKEMQAEDFLNEEKRMFRDCHVCKFRKLCQGHCKRMNVTFFEEDTCFYGKFLEETYQIFHMLGRYIRK